MLSAAAAAVVLLHLYGLYRPTGPPSPSWFPYADKVQHALGFAAPVALILLARAASVRAASVRAAGQGPSGRFVLVVVAVFALHAVVSELIQHVGYVHRTGDPVDVLADWLGVAVGWTAGGLVATWSHRAGTGRVTNLSMPR